ncbi:MULTISPECIES: TIM-barrel domain-containing protein [unclassified Actinotalea]|uniref:glycoside hydrolase family 31 protein n=1 Tax=unclassified Actinotalea TaxID=2638618 RepID=UPI0015F6DD6A|nr:MULTISPECIES: TIM-barrel domain-containing protein [unclassified Actinotalea]
MIPRTDNHLHLELVDGVERTGRGLLAALGGERFRVDVVRDDVVRLAMSRGGVFDEQPTHAVCVDPLSPDVAFEVERSDDVVRVRTAALVVSLWLDPFRVDVHRADGSPVIETARGADGRYGTYATLNDAFVLRRRCRPEDAIYGLGEKTGRHNRKGRDFTLWNSDVLSPDVAGAAAARLGADDPRADASSTEFDPYYVSIPFFYHQRWPGGAMAGSFLDNGYRVAYDFTAPDEYVIRGDGGQWCEYVFAGPRMPDILEAYTWLTGRTPLPPLWSLGYHQSRWHAYAQEAVEQVARRHRELDVPCDALWLDIEYMDGYRVFTWDRERFPDPPGMLARLRDDGFRVITIIDPGVKHDPGYAVFDEAVEKDLLCRTEGGDLYVGQVWPGRTAFPDFVTQETRAWWGRLNAEHVRSGLAGIWNDMNEPATGDVDPGRMRFGRGRFSHERFHNQYALLMAMGTVEGLRAAMPELRTFVLTRAGSAGIQRYAANWMGDNQSRWDHLWLSIPMANGFGVSGQAFVGADVGGFFGSTDAELFLRWMQYGALTPFFRNHSAMGNVDQYVWAFGDVVLAGVREAIRLRYRLLPYLYSAFVVASETGAPVQRPLVLDHQDDAVVRDVDDQYLLGPHLLVAPVVEPGTTHRQVYLPAGEWVDWHTGERHVGPRFVVAQTPMERIPLYVRAGAVVPMWERAPASTAEPAPELVELHLRVPALDGTATSMLQEDDGLTVAAVDGAHVRTTFEVTRAGGAVTVRARTTGDGFPGHRRTAFRVVLHGAVGDRARLDDAEVPVEDGVVLVPGEREGFTLELRADGR